MAILKLMIASAIFSAMSFAQTAPLAYNPVAAEYSASMDRIVMVSGSPSTLHILDPVSRQETGVGLIAIPLSLALSPDGLRAAVGHDSLVSYVNLVTGSVEKTFSVPVKAGSVVLSATMIYVLPTYVSDIVNVNLATGVVTPNGRFYYGSGGRLNTAVNAIYGTSGGGPDFIQEYDISTGPVTRQITSPYFGGNEYCVNWPLWFSPDGTRIYTGCGTAFRASKDPKLDMYYLSTLTGVSSIGAFAESAALKKVAAVQKGSLFPVPQSPANDDVVALFESTYLKPVGQFMLPPFVVNGVTFQPHGKWVFFNSASTELYAITQADQGSGLLNTFALWRLPLSLPASCGASFSLASASIPAFGSTGTTKISASPDCIYQASTTSPWVQIISGGYGSGNGALTYSVRSNPSSSLRSATISIGGQIFTINQDGAATKGPVTLLGYNAVDAAYDKPLDRIVLVSSNPDELHIVDVSGQADLAVPLAVPPLSVSVRPDGAYAAVGHDGWVSYVNLQTGVVEKLIQVSTDVHHILLAGNGYAYLFPVFGTSNIYSLELASGNLTASNGSYAGRVPRLLMGGKYMYLGGYGSSKWDLSQGVAMQVDSGPFSAGIPTCGGNIWLAEDGRRGFNACAKAYLTSDIPAQDGQYNGMLSAAGGLVWADESALRSTTAVIPSSGSGAITANDTQLQFYGDASLAYNGVMTLPSVSINGKSFATHGRFVFWNQAATALYAVVQADTSAQLAAAWGVAQVSTASSNQYALTIAASPMSAGNVSPASGTSYPAGSFVTVSVTPSAPNSIPFGTRTFQFSSWTGPVANPALASTTVTMTGPLTITANLIPTSSFFVTELYRDLLSRIPDTNGFYYWTGLIDTGRLPRSVVASSLFTSPEFTQSGLYIIKLYVGVLGRDPDFGGWLNWFTGLRNGATSASVLNAFLASAEFQNTYGSISNSDFVNLVYRNVLQRPPDPGGLANWLGQLNSGVISRGDVMGAFVNGPEFDSIIRSRAYANLLYMGFLRRTPDPAGLTYWNGILTAGNPLSGAIYGFINGPEYLNRLAGLTP